MRSIRQELLEGRFHDYCLRSQACPIVRKSEEAHALPFRQRALQRVRHRWGRLNRDLNGVPNRVWLPIRWVVTRVWRGLTDPSYVARHARRMRGISRAP